MDGNGWLLERIEKGAFLDPSEATFVLLGEQEELEPHIDLRRELLRRSLDGAINDPRPSLPAKQVLMSSEKTSQPWRRSLRYGRIAVRRHDLNFNGWLRGLPAAGDKAAG